MTYCVGMMLDKGMAFMSDSRTNSGVDNVSTFRKMFHWEVPGERFITLLTAGNLATTQAVIAQLEERSKAPEDRKPPILEAPTMFQVASHIGLLLRETILARAMTGATAASPFSASMILGGQIKGMEPRLYMIYPEGNFIEASRDTPFFQIGETKYGRPILVRGFEASMEFADIVKLLMVSFDSTLKANLSVGLPLDLLLYRNGDFAPFHERRITTEDPYFESISESWSEALRSAFHSLPNYELEG
ncbi:MAG: proteasome-type protease [Sphingorhabdus sp.]